MPVTNEKVHSSASGLALYLVYHDVGLMSEWLSRTLGFVEQVAPAMPRAS